jgi:hypothetical protein
MICATIVGPREGRWDPRNHGEFVPHEYRSTRPRTLSSCPCHDRLPPLASRGRQLPTDAGRRAHFVGRLVRVQRQRHWWHVVGEGRECRTERSREYDNKRLCRRSYSDDAQSRTLHVRCVEPRAHGIAHRVPTVFPTLPGALVAA